MGGELNLRVRVGIKLMHPDAKVPVYTTDEAAGADLCALEGVVVAAGNRALIQTGVAIELPSGTEAQVRPRSGLALKHGITVLNTPGTIDADYRGSIGVILFNTSGEDFVVNAGDRIAQLVVAPVLRAEFLHTGGLSPAKRSKAGFGSTGTGALS